MIFDREDVSILQRVMVRKSVEVAAISGNRNMTDVQQLLISEELTRDISRCELMISVGTNDFADIDNQLKVFDESLSAMPPSLYSAYMSTMTEEDRNDEGGYLWMLATMISNVGLLQRGLGLVDNLAAAEEVVPHQDIRAIKELRSSLADVCRRSDALEGELLGSGRFADVLSKECSLILRINSGKEVGSEEISEVFDEISRQIRRSSRGCSDQISDPIRCCSSRS